MLEILNTKTARVAIGGILVAIGSYLTGNLELAETIKLFFEGVLVMTARHAFAKGK